LAYKVIISALFLVLGSYLVISQQMNIGQFVAAEIIVLLVINSVEKLIYSLDAVYDVLTALVKMGQVLDLELEIEEKTQIVLPENTPLEIDIERMSFWFPDKVNPIINNISLNIKPGEKLMILGKDGSGKSLLLHLLAGFYDEYKGQIQFNKIPLRKLNKNSLRSLIGDNLSSESIFRASILDNITLGSEKRNYTEIQRVIETFGLKSFILHAENGLDTMLEPEGQKLPRSVKAKLLLARAALCGASLVLLDDNFHRISEEDQTRILDYFLDREKTWTVIFNSNNILFANKFDRIIGLQLGEITGEATPSRLKSQTWFKNLIKPR